MGGIFLFLLLIFFPHFGGRGEVLGLLNFSNEIRV